jgi:hypothetical protein
MIYHSPTLRAESENHITGFSHELGESYVLRDSSIRPYDSQNSVRPFDLLTGIFPGADSITPPTRVRKEAYAVGTR